MISSLKKDKEKDKHYGKIVLTLESMLRDISDLMEDPLFVDNIHGEQELSLDQTVELLSGIRSNFLPLNVTPEISPAHESGMIDVS
jgi:hypothetical protein